MSRLSTSFPGLKTELLTSSENEGLEELLASGQHNPPELEDIWNIMDRVWDSYGCNNKNLDWERIGRFYQHHVWLMNGLFIEQHPESRQHREAIVDWVVGREQEVQRVLDFGGGFGTLARFIAQASPAVSVDIFELHPSRYALSLAQPFDSIRFIDNIASADRYDCVISTDVIEHVEDPIRVLQELVSAATMRGYLVLASNFFPVIKCHLPGTFHLRFSFNLFTHLMGLKRIGPVHGSHATAYQKVSEPRVGRRTLRCLEGLSQMAFPCLKSMHMVYKQLRRFFQ